MKKLLSFEFWQKFGKALMVVVAVMPAAGLMISIGKTIPMINADWAFLITTGGVIENIGWAIIGNLHLLFALAIGGSWAKERAGGAFAAGIAFILINRITGSIFGVTSAMLTEEGAFTHTLFGTKIMIDGFFTSVLEAPALNMGVFVGIIAGFVGATAYNKYYNFRKLPDALSFFNGKRFVPFVVIARSVVVALVIDRLALYSGRHQQLRFMDRAITRKCARFSTVLIWNLGAAALTIRAASHVDDPDQLHRIRWNLHDSFWRTSRHPSLWTRPIMACMGNGSSEHAQCWRYVTISIFIGKLCSCPL